MCYLKLNVNDFNSLMSQIVTAMYHVIIRIWKVILEVVMPS